MAKATKTFKIGEYAIGGIISVEINGNEINVINKEWDNSAGYSKNSSQKNAKVLSRYYFNSTKKEVRWELFNYLCELSTSYYADEIIKWIETKIKFSCEW